MTCACHEDHKILYAYDDGSVATVCKKCGKHDGVSRFPITINTKQPAEVQRPRWQMLAILYYGSFLWAVTTLLLAVTLVPMAVFFGSAVVLILCCVGLSAFRAWVKTWRKS
jgi:hypothetical protein